MYLIICFIFLFSSDLFSKEDNVYNIISKNPDLSTFKDYLDKTGLDDVLQKKIPYKPLPTLSHRTRHIRLLETSC